MFEIIICPIKQLYMLAEDGDMSEVAVLAASSYDINWEKLSVFKQKLCLNFNDVRNDSEHNAFTKDASTQIAKFVRSLPKNMDTLFVCCDSGESRSTAMAAAIMRHTGIDELKIWRNPHYHPNPLVYKLLCDAFGIPVLDEDVAERIAVNNKALSDAING